VGAVTLEEVYKECGHNQIYGWRRKHGFCPTYIYLEDGSSKFLRNSNFHRWDYTVSQSERC